MMIIEVNYKGIHYTVDHIRFIAESFTDIDIKTAIHRDDGPAIIWDTGDHFWYQQGILVDFDAFLKQQYLRWCNES